MSEGVASSPARPSRGRWLGLRVALVALAALVPARALALEHPPDLVAEGDCEAWVGSVSGNDPSVRVSARLCPAGEGGVSGRLQWSSLRSGYNVRAIEGRWLDGGKSLELRDVRIVEQHPEPGWMFCTIDRYTLARVTPDALEGRYDSAACRDHAKVSLRRVPRTAAPPPPSGGATTGPPPASAAPPDPAAPSAPSAVPPAPTPVATSTAVEAAVATASAPGPGGRDAPPLEPSPPARAGGCGCALGPAARDPLSGLSALTAAALALAFRGRRRVRAGRFVRGSRGRRLL